MKKLLQNFEEYLGIFLLVMMTILTVVNVFSRFVLNASIAATEEITTCSFVLLSLLGASICTKRKSHLGLTLLTDMFPKRYQRACTMLGCVCGCIFCMIVIYYGIQMVISEYVSKQLTLGMGWPEWIFGSFVPFGCTLICLRFAQVGILTIKETRR